jgi:hypothetical protein
VKVNFSVNRFVFQQVSLVSFLKKGHLVPTSASLDAEVASAKILPATIRIKLVKLSPEFVFWSEIKGDAIIVSPFKHIRLCFVQDLVVQINHQPFNLRLEISIAVIRALQQADHLAYNVHWHVFQHELLRWLAHSNELRQVRLVVSAEKLVNLS